METEYEILGRKVILIGANHCIGAAMFIFKSEKGNVLHTGDFRYRPQMLDKIKKFTDGKGVDYIHMDNTFATIGEQFPSQKYAYHDLVKIIEIARAKYNNCLQVNLYCYTLGKEELFDSLSRHFNTKVALMKDAYLRMCLAGMDMTKRFVYKQKYDARRDGPLFIYVKKMRDRPRTLEDINKKPG